METYFYSVCPCGTSTPNRKVRVMNMVYNFEPISKNQFYIEESNIIKTPALRLTNPALISLLGMLGYRQQPVSHQPGHKVGQE